MDLLIEFVVQLVIQFVVEVIFESLLEGAFDGLARAMRTRSGQRSLTAAIGLVFGIAWGWHLASQPHPPKLLWVSLALALGAIVLMRWNRDSSRRAVLTSRDGFWGRALSPPWNWPSSRWVDFGVLNVAIAAGIIFGYSLG